MYGTLLIVGIVLIAGLLALAMWCCYRAGREDGYEARIADEKEAERAERAQVGRHARTQPRTAPSRNPATGTWHLPIPGPPRPQAGRDSGAGTETFAKVDRGVTGPIAKLVADNEAWNAQQAVEDEIFRLGLALD